MEAAAKESQDRRKKNRFAIRSEMRYKLVEGNNVVAQGMGETINISSGGVLFAAGQPLQPGAYVELSICWPVLLGEETRMRLVVFGRVLRSTPFTTACTVDKYEYRTQARSAASSFRRDSMLERWVGETQKEEGGERESGGRRINLLEFAAAHHA